MTRLNDADHHYGDFGQIFVGLVALMLTLSVPCFAVGFWFGSATWIVLGSFFAMAVLWLFLMALTTTSRVELAEVRDGHE